MDDSDDSPAGAVSGLHANADDYENDIAEGQQLYSSQDEDGDEEDESGSDEEDEDMEERSEPGRGSSSGAVSPATGADAAIYKERAAIIARYRANLFQWVCQNCTHTQPLHLPAQAAAPSDGGQSSESALSEAMDTFAGAVYDRLQANRVLTMARSSYATQMQQWNFRKSVYDSYKAEQVRYLQAAIGASAQAAAVVAGGVGAASSSALPCDIDVDITTSTPKGTVVHAHAHVTASAAASDSSSGVNNGVGSSTSTAVAMSDAPSSSTAASATVTATLEHPHLPPGFNAVVQPGQQVASWRSALPIPSAAPPPPEPGPQPTPPDFASLTAALPPVPAVPVIPASVMSSLVCDNCDAPFIRPSPSSNQPIIDADSAVPGAIDRAVISMKPGVVTVPCHNNDILQCTMRYDVDDPSSYLRDCGLSSEFIQSVLASSSLSSSSASAPGQNGHDPDHDHSDSDHSDELTREPATMAVQMRHPDPVQHTFAHGFGGFAPVTAICYDDRMLMHEEVKRPAGRGGESSGLALHLPGVQLPQKPVAPHPERPDRLRSIAQHLVATGLFQRCKRIQAVEVKKSDLQQVHQDEFLSVVDNLDSLVATAGGQYVFDTGDTYANPHTRLAAQLACGSVVAVTEAVVKGSADRGVALVRPPGHHAEPDRSLGFCLYNNVGVAAAVARKRLGCKRVLIVDWDVHHGECKHQGCDTGWVPAHLGHTPPQSPETDARIPSRSLRITALSHVFNVCAQATAQRTCSTTTRACCSSRYTDTTAVGGVRGCFVLAGAAVALVSSRDRSRPVRAPICYAPSCYRRRPTCLFLTSTIICCCRRFLPRHWIPREDRQRSWWVNKHNTSTLRSI